MSGKAGAQMPQMAKLIDKNWAPSEKLRKSPQVRGLEEEELKKLVSLFHAFCAKHELQRAHWGHTFVLWLKRRGEADWVPKKLTDVWE